MKEGEMKDIKTTCPICRHKFMVVRPKNQNGWRSVKDELPEVIEKDGGVNSVLVYGKDHFDCGSDIQVWNTAYFNRIQTGITHWMPLPSEPDL